MELRFRHLFERLYPGYMRLIAASFSRETALLLENYLTAEQIRYSAHWKSDPWRLAIKVAQRHRLAHSVIDYLRFRKMCSTVERLGKTEHLEKIKERGRPATKPVARMAKGVKLGRFFFNWLAIDPYTPPKDQDSLWLLAKADWQRIAVGHVDEAIAALLMRVIQSGRSSKSQIGYSKDEIEFIQNAAHSRIVTLE